MLCTEVLEHVPDPVAALKAMVGACRDGGQLIITVPLISLMHQAPYWYSSGLSPFWFQYWSSHLSVEIERLEVFGDYGDLLAQESSRIVAERGLPRGSGRLAELVVRRLTRKLPRRVLTSGGFGVLFSGRKTLPV